VPVVAQIHRPTWYRRAVFLHRTERQLPTGPPRGEYKPWGRPPGGESQSDRGSRARAGTKSAASGPPHPSCMHWCGDHLPTFRLRGGKTHPPQQQAPRHQGGLHSPPRRPYTRPDSGKPDDAGRRSQRYEPRRGGPTRFPPRRVGAPPPPRGRLSCLQRRTAEYSNTAFHRGGGRWLRDTPAAPRGQRRGAMLVNSPSRVYTKLGPYLGTRPGSY